MRANPYVAFSVFYVLSFVWAFSNIGNFGILARQRVLMLPLFLVVLALPALSARVTARGTQATHTATPQAVSVRQ